MFGLRYMACVPIRRIGMPACCHPTSLPCSLRKWRGIRPSAKGFCQCNSARRLIGRTQVRSNIALRSSGRLGSTRDSSPVGAVTLNPERNAVAQRAAGVRHTQPMAA
jgi:hypothetical protein